MITLDPHDGDLGMSAWVDCHDCQRRPGPQRPLGWFAIRAWEPHWVNRATNHHWHHDCGLALVDAGLAVIRDLPQLQAVGSFNRAERAHLKEATFDAWLKTWFRRQEEGR